jgi:hypothetical protein
MATGVARNSFEHAVDLLKVGFRAPKTTASKNSRTRVLRFSVHRFVYFAVNAHGLMVAKKNRCHDYDYKTKSFHMEPPYVLIEIESSNSRKIQVINFW